MTTARSEAEDRDAMPGPAQVEDRPGRDHFRAEMCRTESALLAPTKQDGLRLFGDEWGGRSRSIDQDVTTEGTP